MVFEDKKAQRLGMLIPSLKKVLKQDRVMVFKQAFKKTGYRLFLTSVACLFIALFYLNTDNILNYQSPENVGLFIKTSHFLGELGLSFFYPLMAIFLILVVGRNYFVNREVKTHLQKQAKKLQNNQMEHRQEKLILNGKFKLIIDLTEFRMSLWINGFGLSNAVTGEEITPVITIFNLEKFEEDGDVIKIKFRIYPDGSKYYNVEINPFSKRFVYENETYPTVDFFKTITGEEWK